MTSQSDVATDESEESVSEEATEQTSTAEKPDSSFLSDLLKDAAASGHSIGDAKLPEQPETEEIAAAETTDELASEEDQTALTEEETEEEEEKPQVAEHKSIEDQIKEFTDKGEKAPWYLLKIRNQGSKLGKRDAEIEKAHGKITELSTKVTELEGQLSTKSAPQPNGKDPLADIFDEPGLQRMKGVYKRVIRLADLNPDGVSGETWTKADGTEVELNLTREQLIDMKLEAQEMLSEGIPARRNYLVNRSQKDAEARKIYPELSDDDTGWQKLGQTFLSNVPELQRDPEVWLWIARAIRGWQWELAQIQSNKSKPTPKESANKIIESSRVKKAPVTPTTKGFVRRSGADLDKARKELQEKGDKSSGMKLLEALNVGAQRSRKPALIES